MKIFALIAALLLVAPGCREEPSVDDCKKMANKRANLIFKGKSDRQSKRAKKMEFATSFEECMASWSKEEAACIAGSRNRTQMIACR